MKSDSRGVVSIGARLALFIASTFLVATVCRAQVGNTATGYEALSSNVGSYNTADGYCSLYTNTTGYFNTAVGYEALYWNTSGSYNTTSGWQALAENTTGYYNTAIGYLALAYNTTGGYNSAFGVNALVLNRTGVYNTANGSNALYNNSSGDFNTATGANALYNNTTGSRNMAGGFNALYCNTTGTENTAYGNGSLYSNTRGSFNTANGFQALATNTTGAENTATGNGTLYFNTTGSYNTANGIGSLDDNTVGNSNTADGYFALSANVSGNHNIALGYGAGQSIYNGSFNIDIGNEGTDTDTGTIRIGTKGNQTAAYIAGVDGMTASGGVAVYINSNGQLGTLTSSRRFKFDIKDIGAKSDKLMDLRPVTFRYKEAAGDGTHPIQYGLIAEEVAKVYPDLVQYDKQGKPFTVYYHLLTPIMLNELQKAHQQLAEQQAEFTSFKAEMLRTTSAGRARNTLLQSQVISLQLANQMHFTLLAGLLIALAAYALGGRTRRISLEQSHELDIRTA